MVVTEMNTSNRVSDKGLGMKRKDLKHLGSVLLRNPILKYQLKSPSRKVRVKTMSLMLCSKNYLKFKYLGQIT